MNVQIKPSPLPATREDLLKRKTMAGGPSLNDDMDRIHLILWDNPDYRRFHDAVFDADAVEGSRTADDFEAVRMIRKYASEHEEFYYVAKKNLETLRKSMRVVLRRYHMSREERAMTVAGEVVPGNGNTAAAE